MALFAKLSILTSEGQHDIHAMGMCWTIAKFIWCISESAPQTRHAKLEGCLKCANHLTVCLQSYIAQNTRCTHQAAISTKRICSKQIGFLDKIKGAQATYFCTQIACKRIGFWTNSKLHSQPTIARKYLASNPQLRTSKLTYWNKTQRLSEQHVLAIPIPIPISYYLVQKGRLDISRPSFV